MIRSILIKTFLRYLFLFILIFSLVLFVSYRHNSQIYQESLKDSLRKLAVAIKPLAASPAQLRSTELDPFLKELGRKLETRITVINPNGNVLADSEKDIRLMENHSSRPEIRQAYLRKTGFSIRYSTTVKAKMMYVAIPLDESSPVPSVLRVSCYMKDVKELIDFFDWKITRMILILLGLSVILSFFLARNLSRPVEVLSAAFKKVEEGDLESRVFIRNRDEFRVLADNFNQLVDRLRETAKTAEKSRDDLLTVLASIEEGLLAIDGEGRVVLSNPSMNLIIGNPIDEGKFYWEVFRDQSFTTLISSALDLGENKSIEIEINEQTFQLLVTHYPVMRGVVVLFHNISEYKKLEKIKRDFVVNLSHELRTPLTAIKGFVETLEEEESVQNRNYLSIIMRHTERMIRLVNDLLVLSELEEKNQQVHFQPVDFPQLVENILKMFERKVKDKKINLSFHAASELPPVAGEPFKLEQLVINLVDNALKYTDERGQIDLSAKQDQGVLLFKVSDSGVGIAAEHLERIFERFYVVDKSRSRKTGGTGLGLSIVKHVVLLHKGRIQVESNAGCGTDFYIWLPFTNPANEKS